MCHIIAISPPVDLFVPVALLRLPALVTPANDMIKTYGTGDIVYKQPSPGP